MKSTGPTTEARTETTSPSSHTISHHAAGNSRSNQYNTSRATSVNPYPMARLFASSKAQPRQVCRERLYRTSMRWLTTENGRPANQRARYNTEKYAKTVHSGPAPAQSRNAAEAPDTRKTRTATPNAALRITPSRNRVENSSRASR